MTDQTIPIPAGYRQDSQGRLVPESIIPDSVLLRDDLVRELIAQVQAATDAC